MISNTQEHNTFSVLRRLQKLKGLESLTGDIYLSFHNFELTPESTHYRRKVLGILLEQAGFPSSSDYLKSQDEYSTHRQFEMASRIKQNELSIGKERTLNSIFYKLACKDCHELGFYPKFNLMTNVCNERTRSSEISYFDEEVGSGNVEVCIKTTSVEAGRSRNGVLNTRLLECIELSVKKTESIDSSNCVVEYIDDVFSIPPSLHPFQKKETIFNVWDIFESEATALEILFELNNQFNLDSVEQFRERAAKLISLLPLREKSNRTPLDIKSNDKLIRFLNSLKDKG
ncbi:hypothetical protein ROZALSC1DRAFT_28165, partial [Rozella allomycis CSF55]